MKKATRLFMTALALTALIGFTACDPDDKPEPTPVDPTPVEPTPDPIEDYEESTSYAIYYEGEKVLAGHTVVYNLTDEHRDLDYVSIDFVPENLTGGVAMTVVGIEMVEGPNSMKSISFCADLCRDVTCPYTSNPYQLGPGMNSITPISYHCSPSQKGTGITARYKLTVGKGENIEDPQVFFLRVNL